MSFLHRNTGAEAGRQEPPFRSPTRMGDVPPASIWYFKVTEQIKDE